MAAKRLLWDYKQAIAEFLQGLRLSVHDRSAQVTPVAQGVPWLGFVGFTDHRRVKARKVTAARRRLGERFEAWRRGRISFAEFDVSVQGWINHVRYADTWRLRERILQPFGWGPEAYADAIKNPHAAAARRRAVNSGSASSGQRPSGQRELGDEHATRNPKP